ncbi:MAG TPA: APC family permease [Opitutaceae bacterium]|jgi:amino acid transporter|nr:APC family permease [Opitutaceae bacterium]
MRIKHLLLGKPRDVHDPHLFHKISLIAFLAWVGLGADGLSSSAYGPDEAFRAILDHRYLAVALALATAGTVFIISLAYSRLIEHFPAGGGGYVVATKLLGPSWGVISGCALLVDYVLTITTSMAAAVDQVFSFIPPHYAHLKLGIECALIVVLILLNLRGVKESVAVVVPIFMLFIVTHAIVLVGCLVMHGHNLPAMAGQLSDGLRSDYHQLGLWAIFLIFMNAYSRGAGTYTGIEAVSNGVPIMREPRVATAKRTMLYMAASLAITAGGILLCYVLVNAAPEEGKTLNAVLIERLGFGSWFVVLSLVAEGGLLFVAAQTGFIDGPRVMANMSLDGWLPHRFSVLSERLTMHYGVLLIGGASIMSLFYTGGDVTALVTMYSINVFVTFSLSQLGMCRFWIAKRREESAAWLRPLLLHSVALTLCALILIMVVVEKFTEGGWMTLLVTSALIGLCWLIRRHYRDVQARLRHLSEILVDLPKSSHVAPADAVLDPAQPTAVMLVAAYSGLGVHSLLAVLRTFPRHYKQVVFASVGVLDSGNFKGAEEVEHLEVKVRADLEKYCELARGLGLPAAFRLGSGIDPVSEAVKLCEGIAGEFPRAVFFGGKLIFQRETWWGRVLHNETAFAIQRRLQWLGRPMLVLPVRVGG